MALHKKEQKDFVKVLASDGSLRLEVPEGTEGAVTREYEDSKGNKGSKTELVFGVLSGKITGVEIIEGNFGNLLQIEVTDEQGSMILSLAANQNFGEDVMKKLPNIDFEKEVEFAPYSFEDEGKSKRGMTITQDGQKIQNFFYDPETKETKYGFPEVEDKKYTKDDWKIYFLQVQKFLNEYITENVIPQFGKVTESDTVSAEDIDNM